MTSSYRSRRLCSRLWLLGLWCWLGCGSEPPAPSGPPPVPAGPPRNVMAAAGIAGSSGTVSAPASAGSAAAAAVGGGDSQAADAGVGPPAAGTRAAVGGSAGSSGTAGQAGQAGAAGAGRGAGGMSGAGGASGAAGAADQTCRDVFCFTPLECLFFTVPCGFSDCTNFTCT